MKNYTLLIILFLSVKSGAQTIYPSGVSGCIARWTFDVQQGGNLTTIQDWSGNNNHGNNNNITSVTGWKGIPFTAGKFNGSTSFSQVPFNPNFISNQITAMALVKFDGFFSGSCQGNNIVYNGFDYNSNLNWALYTSDGAYDGSCAAYNPNYNKTYFTTPNYVNAGTPLNNYIDSSKWYLIAASYNGSTINYYELVMDSTNKLNNILPSYSANNNYPVGTGSFDIFMGATQNPPFPYWFNGKMDEVILFNRALTNTEIQSVYDYLFGYPVATSNIEKRDNVNLTCINKHLRFFTNNSPLKSITIYDINGHVIKQVNEVNSNEINLSDIPSQIIFVKIFTADNNIINKKLLLAE